MAEIMDLTALGAAQMPFLLGVFTDPLDRGDATLLQTHLALWWHLCSILDCRNVGFCHSNSPHQGFSALALRTACPGC